MVEEFVDADSLAQTLKKINKYNVKGASLALEKGCSI